MNKIDIVQNETRQIQYLAAQRQLYASAKTLAGWQVAFAGPIATLLAVVGIVVPSTKAIVALSGATLLLLDILWLTPKQKQLREAGAKVQERFDCTVLGLSWNSFKCGSPEPPELVLEQATRYANRVSQGTPLANWYPSVVATLPIALARLVCQRSNCWWDAKQRRSYAAVLAGILLTLVVAVLWAGIAAHLQLTDLMLIVVAPMSSTVKLAHQLWKENREAADRLDRLRERSERCWSEALSLPDETLAERDARSLQDEIFDGRKRNPLVFDFVFNRLRAEHEDQMKFGASELVAEASLRLSANT